jgi:hypothetical protein
MQERGEATSTTPARILNRDSNVWEVEDYETVRVLGGAATALPPPPTPTFQYKFLN